MAAKEKGQFLILTCLCLSYWYLLFSIDYQPVRRKGHSTVRVGDCLYMWGGSGLPKVHNNEEKKSKSSVMDVCHLETGRWEQKPTTGDPPLGVLTYAVAPIGNEIFYFGGHCNHKECYHNSLYR